MSGGGHHQLGTVTIPDMLLGTVLAAALGAIVVGRTSPFAGAMAAGAVGLLLLWRASSARQSAREAEEDAKFVARIFDASQSVLCSLDVSHVLHAAAEVGARLSGHAGGSVLFLADDTERPVFWASWGIEPLPGRDTRFRVLEPHVSEVLRTRRSLIVPLPREMKTDLNEGGRFRSACVLPLTSKAGLVGSLALLSEKDPRAFQSELPTLEYFAAQAATAIDNARLYQQVQDLFLSTIKSLAAAVDAKDAYTHGHSEDIAELVAMMAREMKLPPREEEKVRLAGLLHDIGKIGIPDAILRKPGKLDPGERAVMMTHVTVGASIIDRPGPLRDLVAIVRHHHEHYDGRGYPEGLRGEGIPIGAAILAVADAFDAMTSHRIYHAARSIDAALEELRRHAGTQFNPRVVEALLAVVERERSEGSDWYRAIERRIQQAGTGQPTPVQEQAVVADEMELSWRLGQLARAADDVHTAAEHVVRGTAEALGSGHCAILLLEDHGQVLRVEASTGSPEPGSLLPRGRGGAWYALEQRAAGRQEDGGAVHAPLVCAGQSFGVLQATGGGLGEPALRLLTRVADTVAPVIHAGILRAFAERVASADDVTGLLNRRALVTRLHEEARRHKRYGTRFALALGDIQDLAEFNQTHGYTAGDELMRRLGEIMVPGIRQTDFLARLEGGTFGVLMPELDYDQAGHAVQRMQDLLADREVVVGGRFIPLPALTWVTVACPTDGIDADALLAAAEKRLHTARQRAAH